MKNKRVCILIPSHWAEVMGGAQYQAKLLIDRMHRTGGFDIHYLARTMPDNWQAEDHTLHRCGNSKGLKMVFDAPDLLRLLRELKPDTIYQQVGCAYTGIAAWYCRSAKAKLVWQIASDIDVEPWSLHQRHNPVFSYIDKKMLEYGLRKADAVIAQTSYQDSLLQANYGRPADAIIPNFHPPRKEVLDKTGVPGVLWIANLKQLKQPEIFVDIASRLQHLNARFYIIGGMQLPPAIAAPLLESIEALDNLEFVGQIDQDEVNARLATSHALVNTSLYEGFSNTFIQAWQRAVPVCSLNVNPDNLLTDSLLGTCADGDVAKLAQQLADILGDSERQALMGEACCDYAEKNHSELNADRVMSFF